MGDQHSEKQGYREVMPILDRLPHDPVSPSELEKIDRALIEDVRGFVDDPIGWFRTPNDAFEGRRPIELLGTDDESRLRNRIEAAKLGMFS